MTHSLESSRQLAQLGISFRLIQLPRAPRSAADIVEMYGCELGQVLKSLLFVGDKANVLACIPGDRHVDVAKLSRATGNDSVRLATAKEVRELTGHEVGGLSPFLPRHLQIAVVIDSHCLERETVNVGAGTPTSGVELASGDLTKIWPSALADISQ